ncbi:transcriptional regulator [Testudinibacter sp. TR-2022]|uniref:Mor transcription activator family protein n=1 Tax=Testudinibacter sp. TR-2022 TaxID=2585029 RepID=UPI00111BA395|nr:Mor transcription activator family protein [Testudinibacter sp. TR-2022]TNH04489.1 transcriptional regulator [Pasteurellaceae bacterium Phil31]TNH11989.1 transcriptional regulator [Testudinibacter sp. TR-2022]TNH12706.1 transcriptional regulator [Testudinibacter sp. TR-2022]TNH13701.1 transcriptional regulator [Testudinibacter sp. TR-2022]TNH17217.1 transcriptional regulator [Testudinibacter sp. TR-2022]
MDNQEFSNLAPDFLLDLARYTESAVKQVLDTNDNTAQQVGQLVAMAISKDWRGQSIYIPRGVSLLAYQRDLQIWREFNGFNHAQLAKKFNVSTQWVYRIINRMQKAEIKKIQIDLFPDDQ